MHSAVTQKFVLSVIGPIREADTVALYCGLREELVPCTLHDVTTRIERANTLQVPVEFAFDSHETLTNVRYTCDALGYASVVTAMGVAC
jgi:hypothetical protein